MDDGIEKVSEKYAERIFNELLAFQGYGFCLTYDTVVEKPNQEFCLLGELKISDKIKAPDKDGGLKYVSVTHIFHQGIKNVVEVELDNGKKIRSTLDHKFLCKDGEKHSLKDILNSRLSILCEGEKSTEYQSIRYIDSAGKLPVMDITVDSDEHLFFANGIAASNCKAHAISYSVYSAVQLWLQENYFIEYMCTLLSHIDRAKEKKGISMLEERVQYCISHGTSIYYPNVSSSGTRWEIKGGGILAPLSNIKGFGEKDTETIIINRPYDNIREFMEKTNIGKGKFESLLFANALSDFGDVETLYNWYYNEYTSKSKKNNNLSFDFGDGFGQDDNHISFTEDELKERCVEMNGFFVERNLQIEYPEIYKEGLKRFIDGNKSKIYTISDALSADAENIWIFALVKDVEKNIKSKFGSCYNRFVLADGIKTIQLSCSYLPGDIKKNALLVLPLTFNREEDKVFLSNHKSENYGIFKVEQK